MIRAFLAIQLSSDLRDALATIQDEVKRRLEPGCGRQVKINWVRPSSAHLTLKFLGDIPHESVEPLRAMIEQAVAGHRTLSIPCTRIGVFPRPQQPRVLWVGPSESWEQGQEGQRLLSLHCAIEDSCEAAGFQSEGRLFTAHVTLARIKEGERQVGQALLQSGLLDRPTAASLLSVSTIVLVKSELRPTGSVYTNLWEVRIGDA